jgi:aryl sulfotransferase
MTGTTVWLASYPKSGNTWFRAVYAAWHSNAPVDLDNLVIDGSHGIASSRGRFEQALGLVSSELTLDEIDCVRPMVDDVVDAAHADLHLTKIHDALLSGPNGESIISAEATHAALYMVRDPRDVALSFAHHLGVDVSRVIGYMADEHYCLGNAGSGSSDLLQLRQRLGSWSTHVTSWLDNPGIRVLPIRFEDCLRDPVATFSEAFRFAGFVAGADAGDDSMDRAVECSSFDRLVALEDAGGFSERPDRSPRFFRKGQAGTWRDELDPDLAERICEEHREVMGRLGYLDPI